MSTDDFIASGYLIHTVRKTFNGGAVVGLHPSQRTSRTSVGTTSVSPRVTAGELDNESSDIFGMPEGC